MKINWKTVGEYLSMRRRKSTFVTEVAGDELPACARFFREHEDLLKKKKEALLLKKMLEGFDEKRFDFKLKCIRYIKLEEIYEEALSASFAFFKSCNEIQIRRDKERIKQQLEDQKNSTKP